MDSEELRASSDSEDINNDVPSTSERAPQPQSLGPKRTDHTISRARQRATVTDPSEVAEHRAPHARSASRQSHRQKPLIVVGCLVAAAVATACLRHWLKRRKLRPKAQDVEPLITRCKLQPSISVQNASPSGPLHSTTFVVSQV